MFPVVWVETIRSFGKNKLLDTWAVILTLGFYIYYINYAEDVSYIENRSLKPRTGLGEWVSSIVFAIVAATFVHTYFYPALCDSYGIFGTNPSDRGFPFCE